MGIQQNAWLVCLLAWCHPVVHAADKPQPLKVFILAGQSNMEGQAVVDLDGKNYNDGKGHAQRPVEGPGQGHARQAPQGLTRVSGRCGMTCGSVSAEKRTRYWPGR